MSRSSSPPGSPPQARPPSRRTRPFPVGLAIASCLFATGIARAEPPPAAPTGGMPPLTPALIDNTLEIGGDAIAAHKIDTRMTVAVRVDGHGPYRFVVDSGADTSVIGDSVARALRLAPGTPVTLNDMTGSSRVDRVLVDTLGVGGSEIPDLQIPVLRDYDLGGEGMLGIDALREQRLMLDFDSHTIKVEDARQPAPRLDGEIVVIARRQRGQLILTQARANDRAVQAVIDTGSEITIGNLALRDRLFHRHSGDLTTIPVTGVTGVTVKLQLAEVAELRIGPVILRNVLIAFADVPPFAVFGLAGQPALLLGTDLMETFRRVSLDFRSRKVRFQLRRCKQTGIVLSTSSFGGSRISQLNGDSEACRE